MNKPVSNNKNYLSEVNNNNNLKLFILCMVLNMLSQNQLKAHITHTFKAWPFNTPKCFGTSLPLTGSSYIKFIT
jgi:hypothetical protein